MKHTHIILAFCTTIAACAAEELPLQNQPPIARLSCPDGGHTGAQVAVSGKKSEDVDGKIKLQALVIGDAAPSDQLDAVYTPSVPGVLVVALTVTDDKGASGIANCRIPIDGEPIQLGDPVDPTEGEGEGIAEGEGEGAVIGEGEGETDEPTEGEGEGDVDEPTTPGVATVQAYSISCWFSPWESTYHSDEGAWRDEAEAVLGFAAWSCDHPDLLRSGTVAVGDDFAHVAAASGAVSALPGLAGGPSQSSDYMAIYTTLVTPPAGADALRISVIGDDVTAVMKAGGCADQGGDDTDWCPFAVADREWAVDGWDTGFHPTSNSMSVSGDPIPLQIRVGNAGGAMSWNVDFAFSQGGVPMSETGTFSAP